MRGLAASQVGVRAVGGVAPVATLVLVGRQLEGRHLRPALYKDLARRGGERTAKANRNGNEQEELPIHPLSLGPRAGGFKLT